MRRTIRWYVAMACRELGQTMYRTGSLLQRNFGYAEPLSRARWLTRIDDLVPAIDDGVLMAPNAEVQGAVNIHSGARIWHHTVLRGDVTGIYIGKNSDIGNRVVMHGFSGVESEPVYTVTKEPALVTIVGENVLVGDGATIHGATLDDNSVILPGAVVMHGAVVGEGSIISAGSSVTAHQKVGNGEYWHGSPAKFVRKVTAEEKSKYQSLLAQQAERAKGLLKAVPPQNHELGVHQPVYGKTLRDQEQGIFSTQEIGHRKGREFLKKFLSN
eukprot:TRINITY_DN4297_c0_g1_i1.p1 TRINITY_DN4297_c0_g1~~TRINITY_DN4297_c0_g1_i1.p1  ORF type:complete len:271 (-),score=60.20 TRINITY_DN4297_c0_g1_i1:24-836(-)